VVSETAVLYRDDEGQFRWVRKSGNNEIVNASTESYVRKIDAKANYEHVSGVDAPPLMEEDERA
jgi:uncharacterized protein YegP (UPF0339 family)